ncbi:MAG: TonB family protein [Spirulinaceae cyanobacterium]
MQHSSAFLTAIAQSLKTPPSIAAFASVGMHAMLGVALPSLPFFANVALVGDEPTAPGNQVEWISGADNPEVAAELFNRLPPSVFASSTPSLNDLDAVGPDSALPRLDPLPSDDRFTRNPPKTNKPPVARAPQQPTVQTPRQNISRSVPRQTGSSSSNITARSGRSYTPDPATVAAAQENHRQGAQQGTSRSVPDTETASDFNILSGPRIGRMAIFKDQPADTGPIATAPQSVDPIDWEDDVQARIAEQRTALSNRRAAELQAEAAANNNRLQSSSDTAEVRSVSTTRPYPPAACFKPSSRSTVYRVTVQPDGTVSEPTIIGSSGNGVLDRQAAAVVRGYTFTNVTRVTPFQIEVNFTPDNCPGLAVPNAPAPSAQPSPSPTPQATPQPSPSPTPDAVPQSSPSSTENLNAVPGGSGNASDLQTAPAETAESGAE